MKIFTEDFNITIDCWEDVKRLINIADDILEKTDKRVLLREGEESYYKRVIEEYLDRR